MSLTAISLGLGRTLRLWLRIADSLGQHLAQLSLGLRGFPLEGFLPCRHGHYMGMREGELNPLFSDQTSVVEELLNNNSNPILNLLHVASLSGKVPSVS